MEGVADFIHDRTLVFTITSDGYKYLTLNLWRHCERIGVPWRLMIVCLDAESYKYFVAAKVPAILYTMPGGKLVHKEPALYGSAQFKRLTEMKIVALRELSGRSDVEHLLYLDGDIVLFQDPVPFIGMLLEERSLWFQCDERLTHDHQCSSDPCAAPCTGVIAMRLTEATRSRFAELYTITGEEWERSESDQDYIQRRLRTLNVGYGTLMRPLFPNGTFLPDDLYRIAAVGGPYLLHFNFLLGREKEAAMRSRGLWLV